jgi:hypothetical protein
MASRQFNQFLNTLNVNPVFIEGSFQLGSTGQVVANSFSGAGITASSTITVQKLGLGYYMLQLADPYNRIVGWNFMTMPGPSSTIANDGNGNITAGRAYQILGGTTAVASGVPSTATNWYQLGLNPGLTPQVGQVFVASSGGSTTPGGLVVGQGLVQAIGTTNIDSIEVLPCVNTALAPSSAGVPFNATGGSQIYFQTLTGSSTFNGTTRFNPSSCTIRYNLFLRNSSRLGYNEASTSN